MNLMESIKEYARSNPQCIVLPEGNDPRTLHAARLATDQGLAKVCILGSKDEIAKLAYAEGVNLDQVEIIDPNQSEYLGTYAEKYHEMRKKKGITIEQATAQLKDPLYFGTMMVHLGDANGSVAGAANSTGDVLRPAFQIVKTAPGITVVSSAFFMVLDHELAPDGMLVFADCAVNPNPTAGELAAIAVASAKTAQALGKLDPKVALLSFSTKGSASHELVDKARRATEMAKEIDPQLKIDGEFQADAAIVPKVGQSKAPGSKIAGSANVLIFPDLQSGNIAYKLVQRLANAEAIGPVLQGMAKPINDLSRGCSVEDMVNMIAITAVQAQNQ